MRFTEQAYLAHQARVKGGAPAAAPPGKSKHGNKKVKVDGMTFDSKREYQRWCELCMLQRMNQISQLERQISYELAPAVILDGKKKPALRYVADFRYFQYGETIVEDAKSPHLKLNDVYRIKKHLMKHVHNIDIKEI